MVAFVLRYTRQPMTLSFFARTLLVGSTLFASVSGAQNVRDTRASIADVKAQQAHNRADSSVAAPLSGHSCVKSPAVAAPQGPMQIPHHYLQGSNGPTNPAEAEATRMYGAFESRVAGGANQWLATGNEAEAQCALAQLDSWAQARTLLDYDPKAYSQSWFQVEWTLSSIGISNSVLVNDAKLDQAAQRRVNLWLRDVARKMMATDKPNGNNHHYWRGLAVVAVGVSTGDDELFARGVQAYKEGIAEIDERGALPQEMARHENAIHYQGFALQPLVLLAEFATRQGVDLYSYEQHGRTIRDAILFFANATADPSLVKPYTSDVQKTGFGPGTFAAEAFYVARFGAQGLPAAFAAAPAEHTWQTRLGGDPVVFLAGHPPATTHQGKNL